MRNPRALSEELCDPGEKAFRADTSLNLLYPAYLSITTLVLHMWSEQEIRTSFTFTFSHFADAFIQSDLQLGNT